MCVNIKTRVGGFSAFTINRFITQVLLLFILSVSYVLAAPWDEHGALRVSSNGHYLEHADGTPFYYLSDTSWSMNRLADTQIGDWLDARQNSNAAALSGFTVIQIAATRTSWAASAVPDADGNQPFVSNATDLNSSYWGNLVDIVDAAALRGLYVALNVGDVGKASSTVKCASDAECYEYGRQVALRFKDKPNVIYILGLDQAPIFNGSIGVAGYRAIAEGIADGTNGVNNLNQSADYSNTMMSFLPGGSEPGGSTSQWFPDDQWLDFHGLQPGRVVNNRENQYSLVFADYGRTNPSKPILNLEGQYEDGPSSFYGENIDALDIRRQVLQLFHAGGAGYTYGYWNHWKPELFNKTDLEKNGAKWLADLYPYMQQERWWTWIPDTSIVTSGLGSGLKQKAPVRTNEGDRIYVYFPELSSATIDLSAITADSQVTTIWQHTQFDQQTTAGNGTYSTSETVSFTPPAGWEDAILVVKTKSQGTPTVDYQFTKSAGGTDDDFTTWNRSAASAVDQAGNFYLAGTFKGTGDFDGDGNSANDPVAVNVNGDGFIAKYNSDQTLIWVKTVVSEGKTDVNTIDVDGNGNIYFTVVTTGVVDVGNDGADDFTPGAGNGDFPVLGRLNADGTVAWIKGVSDAAASPGSSLGLYAGVGVNNSIATVVGTIAGSIDFNPGGPSQTVTAASGSNIDNGLYVAQYDKDSGALNKVLVIDAADGITSSGIADLGGMTVDASGNTYIAGSFWGKIDFDPSGGQAVITSTGTGDATFVTRLNADGSHGFTTVISDNGGGDVRDIAVDTNGNVFVAASASNLSNFASGPAASDTVVNRGPAQLVKVDASGNVLWSRSVGGDGILGLDKGRAVTVTPDGSVMFAGELDNSATFFPDETSNLSTPAGSGTAFVALYDNDGNYLQHFMRNANSNVDNTLLEFSFAATSDAQGSVYLAGAFTGTVNMNPEGTEENHVANGGNDVFISKFNAISPLAPVAPMAESMQLSLSLSETVQDQLIAADMDSSVLTYSIQSPASKGTVTLINSLDGTFSYASNGNETGTDTFTFTATDSDSLSAVTATVTVLIASLADSDNDGMADSWELQHFGDLSRDGSGDYDLDGSTDLEEFTNNTDPTIAQTGKSIPDHPYKNSQVFGSNQTDYIYDVDYDTQGNKYIVGIFMGTVNFDPSGISQSSFTSTGSGTNVYVSRFNADGTYAWTWVPSISSATGYTNGLGLAISGAGDVYITGSALGTVIFDGATAVDASGFNPGAIFITKLTATGQHQFTRVIGGASAGGEGKDIGFASDGSYYVTGHFGGSAVFDLDDPSAPTLSAGEKTRNLHGSFITKYGSDDGYLWTRLISPGINTPDIKNGVYSYDLDILNGNVYVAGQFYGDADFDGTVGNADDLASFRSSGWDGFIAEYNTSGGFVQNWQLHGTSDDGSVRPYSITMDTDGSILVAGDYRNSVDFDPDPVVVVEGVVPTTPVEDHAFILKLNSAGNLAWVNTLGNVDPALGSASSYAYDIEIRNSNLYISGTYSGDAEFNPNGTSDRRNSGAAFAPFVSQYSTDGNYIGAWTAISEFGLGGSPWKGGGQIYGLATFGDTLSAVGYYLGIINVNPTGNAVVLESNRRLSDPTFYSHDALMLDLTMPTAVNTAPTAVITVSTDTGVPPLTVNFSGAGSVDPENDSLSYAWDFDGDGITDSTAVSDQFTYTTEGVFTAALTVSDGEFSSTATKSITVQSIGVVNMLVNAGFEDGVETPWRPYGGTTLGLETNIVYTDSYGYRVAGVPTTWLGVKQDNIAVTEGQQYDIGGWLKINGKTETTSKYMLEVRWYDASGAELTGTRMRPAEEAGETEWQHYTKAFFAPPNAVEASLRFQANKATGVGYVDELSITPVVGGLPLAATPSVSPNGGAILSTDLITLSSTTTTGSKIYYTTDGSTPTTASIEYTGPFTLDSNATVKAITVGDTYRSSNVATADFAVGGSNMLSNPGFEAGESPWISSGVDVGLETGGQYSHVGSNAYRIGGDASSWPGVKQKNIPVTENVTYNVGGWLRITGKTETTAGYMLEVRWYDSTGTEIPNQRMRAAEINDNSNWVFKYKPLKAPGGAVSASVRFQANKATGTGYVDDVSFALASVNSPPVAVISASPTNGVDPLTVNFDGSTSTDPENDPLSYAWDFDGDGTIDQTGVNPAFTYTSAGSYTATLTVSDGSSEDTATLTITVSANTPPQIQEFTVPDAVERHLIQFSINVIDVDGSWPSLELINSPTGLTSSVVNNATSPVSSTINLSWTPGAGDVGVHNFTLRAIDGLKSNLVSETAISITVNANSAPNAVINANTNSGVDPLTINFDASGSTDAENDPITFSWDFDGDAIEDSTEVKPTHVYLVEGTYTASVTVSDGIKSSTASMTITVFPNTLPEIQPFTVPTGVEGQALQFTVDAIDLDGSWPDIEVVNGPPGMTFNNVYVMPSDPIKSTLTVDWTPGLGDAGVHNFSIRAVDGLKSSTSVEVPVSLTVEAAALDNMLVNPGFEEGASPWSSYGGTTLGLETTNVHTGSNAYRVTGDPTTWLGVKQDNIAVTEGQQYDIGGWLKINGKTEVTSKYMLEVRWYDASGAELSGTRVRPAEEAGETEWQHYTKAFFAPPNAVEASLRFQANKATGVGYVDDLSMTPVIGGMPLAATPSISPSGGAILNTDLITLKTTTIDAVIYYTTDGSTPTTASTPYTGPFTLDSSVTVKAIAAGDTYRTSAVASADFSIGPPQPENMLINPGFEDGASPWSSYGGTTLGLETTNVHTGSNAYRVTGDPTTWLGVKQDNIAVTEGQQYDIGGWLKINGKTEITSKYMLEVRWYDASGAELSGTRMRPAEEAGETEWQHYTKAFFAPPNAVEASLRFQANKSTGVGYVDDLSMTTVVDGLPLAATPSISPNGGSIQNTDLITLKTTTFDAVIYYTTDGSTPTTASTPYTGPFPLESDATVKAIAAGDTYRTSAVASASFTISVQPPTAMVTPTVSPVDDDTKAGIVTSTLVVASFEGENAASSVTNATVSLSSVLGVVNGSTSVEQIDGLWKILFRPDVPLQTNTSYDANISATVQKAIDGQWAQAEVAWNFTTIDPNAPHIIFYKDFNSESVKTYGPSDETQFRSDWNISEGSIVGLNEGRISIDPNGESNGGNALRLRYEQDAFGLSANGTQWRTALPNSTELYVAYRVKFDQEFDFIRGGKLPGMIGIRTKQQGPLGCSWFSSRMGFHNLTAWDDGVKANVDINADGDPGVDEADRVAFTPLYAAMNRADRDRYNAGHPFQYSYHMDKPNLANTNIGHSQDWTAGGSIPPFIRGQWHWAETRIKLNTPASEPSCTEPDIDNQTPSANTPRDGIVQSWLDGVLAFSQSNYAFRSVSDLKINQLFMVSFFGGGSASWKTVDQEFSYFDDIIVSTKPITH